MRWLLGIIVLLVVGCAGDEQEENTSDSNQNAQRITQLKQCTQVGSLSSFVGGCVLASDGFERDQIIPTENNFWLSAVRDDGEDWSEAVMSIETEADLGIVPEGTRALMFVGQADEFAHDNYLISKAIDARGFDRLAIQVTYLPVKLEKLIALSESKRDTPEGLRIEVCGQSDAVCGINGATPDPEKLRNFTVWTTLWEEKRNFGEGIDLGNHVLADWKTSTVTLNLSSYSSRKANFVFRVSVAMDAGFVNDNPNTGIEDAFILDEVKVYGLRGVKSLDEATQAALRWGGSRSQ